MYSFSNSNLLIPCDPWRPLYWALPEKDAFSFYNDNWVLLIICMCDGLDQPLVVAGQKNKSCQCLSSASSWLSLCLKCPVIWSYHSLALALSHWKINKLLVAYPSPPLPRHPCSPLLSECHHHDFHDNHFTVVILTDHMDALSLYY